MFPIAYILGDMSYSNEGFAHWPVSRRTLCRSWHRCLAPIDHSRLGPGRVGGKCRGSWLQAYPGGVPASSLPTWVGERGAPHLLSSAVGSATEPRRGLSCKCWSVHLYLHCYYLALLLLCSNKTMWSRHVLQQLRVEFRVADLKRQREYTSLLV